MNTPTLSQLADIGAKASRKALPDIMFVAVDAGSPRYARERPAREAFAKAVLDAVGYKLPVDPEREAFDAWITANPSRSSNDDLFDAWKAGRAARDKELEILDARCEQEHAAEIAKPAPETFEAHGYTWFKHTPGDPCPCDPNARVHVLWPSDNAWSADSPRKAEHWNWDKTYEPRSRAIGWRYAESNTNA